LLVFGGCGFTQLYVEMSDAARVESAWERLETRIVRARS
jgi:hypothetical protein